MTGPPTVHWFLPTGGDGERLADGVHGATIGGAGAGGPDGRGLPATLEHLTAVARAAEDGGFTGVLTPTGAHCEDAWLTTAALVPATTRLRFLVAFRPGLVTPVLAAQMATTFQRLSGGRLLLNVVAGGDPVEQRAYGDRAAHDERYARAGEFLDVVRAAWRGQPFDHRGRWYTVEGGRLAQPPDVHPRIYLGGSSEPARELAARHADVHLSWGEPVEAIAGVVADLRRRAERHGRELRFGLRVHVVARETADEAWEAADALIDGIDDATIERRQAALRGLDSVGQRRMLDLHGGDRSRLLIAPNLWAGIGLVRGGAGTALVGSFPEVAARIAEYRAAGVDEFVLSGYPHHEQARVVGAHLLPLVLEGAPA